MLSKKTPILYVPDNLPARDTLAQEGVTNIGWHSESPSDALRMVLINLMPEKQAAEADWMRLIAGALPGRDVKLELARPGAHVSRHTPPEHLERFYSVLSERDIPLYDGIIMNGAPLERVDYPDTDYWEEACMVMDTSQREGVPVMYVCWGAFAAIYHRHGIGKVMQPEKLSGVYLHHLTPDGEASPLTRGLGATFHMPHSRHCILEVDKIPQAVSHAPGWKILAVGSGGSGPAVFSEGRDMYFTAHPEYAPMTLDYEYHRDLAKGMNPRIPDNYYPGDNPALSPLSPPLWKEPARTLMANWLSIFVADSHGKKRQ